VGAAKERGSRQSNSEQIKMMERWFFTMEGRNVVMHAQFESDDGTVGEHATSSSRVKSSSACPTMSLRTPRQAR
jgi:hypothetical protein